MAPRNQACPRKARESSPLFSCPWHRLNTFLSRWLPTKQSIPVYRKMLGDGSYACQLIRQPVDLGEAARDATQARRIWLGQQPRAGEAAPQGTRGRLRQLGGGDPVDQAG